MRLSPVSARRRWSRSFFLIVAVASTACGGDSPTEVGDDGPRPALLAFLAQPSDATAGEVVGPVRVAVLDSAGNLVRSDGVAVTVSLDASTNPDGATLEGGRTAISADGVATFESLSVETAHDGYTLVVETAGVDPVLSNTFAVTPAAAARLAVLRQPDIAEGLTPFDPAFEVAVQDAFGNFVPDAAGFVNVALAVNPTGRPSLGGTISQEIVDGVATFADLRLSIPAEGYVVEASSDGLASATSDEIIVRLTFSQVSAGFKHACGVTVMGFAYCWGSNAFGQLGDQSFEDSAFPVPVANIFRYDQLSAGRDHTCGIVSNTANTFCWGSNSSGQLGISATGNRNVPTVVQDGGRDYTLVSAGSFHTCAIDSDFSAFCWGSNQDGALGDGTETQRDAPVAVAGDLLLRRISAGNGHTCATAGFSLFGGSWETYCWGGLNQFGQVGDGTTTQRILPTPVSGGLNFSSVSAGGAYSCGLTADDVVHCWGLNADGRVGDGTSIDRTTPVPVAGGLEVEALEARVFHACAITTGGETYCWGGNASGGLGDGTTVDRNQPTLVSGGIDFTMVSPGFGLTCGVDVDGAGYCWGANDAGQLGDGSFEPRLTPIRVGS